MLLPSLVQGVGGNGGANPSRLMAEAADAALAIASAVYTQQQHHHHQGLGQTAVSYADVGAALCSMLGATARWYKERSPLYSEALLCLQRTLPAAAGPADTTTAAHAVMERGGAIGRCIDWAGPLLRSRPPTAKAAAQIIARMHRESSLVASSSAEASQAPATARMPTSSAAAAAVATIALALGRFSPTEAFSVLDEAALDARDVLQLISKEQARQQHDAFVNGAADLAAGRRSERRGGRDDAITADGNVGNGAGFPRLATAFFRLVLAASQAAVGAGAGAGQLSTTAPMLFEMAVRNDPLGLAASGALADLIADRPEQLIPLLREQLQAPPGANVQQQAPPQRSLINSIGGGGEGTATNVDDAAAALTERCTMLLRMVGTLLSGPRASTLPSRCKEQIASIVQLQLVGDDVRLRGEAAKSIACLDPHYTVDLLCNHVLSSKDAVRSAGQRALVEVLNHCTDVTTVLTMMLARAKANSDAPTPTHPGQVLENMTTNNNKIGGGKESAPAAAAERRASRIMDTFGLWVASETLGARWRAQVLPFVVEQVVSNPEDATSIQFVAKLAPRLGADDCAPALFDEVVAILAAQPGAGARGAGDDGAEDAAASGSDTLLLFQRLSPMYGILQSFFIYEPRRRSREL